MIYIYIYISLASSDKPPKNSPGYEEHKRQKQEVACWQEGCLQALALCSVLVGKSNTSKVALAVRG